MFFEPQIGLKPLAALCRRLAMSLGAGVDVRTIWQREASAAHGTVRRRYEAVYAAVSAGRSISEGLADSGNYFPLFFRELTHVGESTGHLPEVFRQLAESYEHQLSQRRAFVGSLIWPMLELTLALTVVGIVIFVSGVIPQLKQQKTDLFGLGLSGTSGLITYLCILGAIGAGCFACYRAATRGMLWVAPFQKAVMQVPKLGRALESIALARLCWAMHVTLNSGMDLRPALKMSLESTHNAVYMQHIGRVLASIREGHEVYEALARTKVFPAMFIDAVQVGEQSGSLVESMAILSDQYQDEARSAMTTLRILLGVAVTGLIAGIIIFFIFRVFGFYMKTINDALNMKR